MDDLISRQKARDVIDMVLDSIDHIARMQYGVDHIPSIQPRKGKWEKDEDYGDDAYVCSFCQTIWNTSHIKNMHFCPTCGSDMREGDAE